MAEAVCSWREDWAGTGTEAEAVHEADEQAGARLMAAVDVANTDIPCPQCSRPDDITQAALAAQAAPMLERYFSTGEFGKLRQMDKCPACGWHTRWGPYTGE